jgi:guanylate kinase
LVKLGYNKLVSYTTRKPREGEVDGFDYHFISEEEFITLNNCDFFVEVGEYNNWMYGSAIDDCTDDKVCVVTPHGLRQLKKNKYLNIHSFYIDVPRRDRLIKILQRGDSIEEAVRRNISDCGQYDGIEDEVDYVIKNDGYEKSAKDIAIEINEIVKGE